VPKVCVEALAGRLRAHLTTVLRLVVLRRQLVQDALGSTFLMSLPSLVLTELFPDRSGRRPVRSCWTPLADCPQRRVQNGASDPPLPGRLGAAEVASL
jgi:hypothetical protein